MKSHNFKYNEDNLLDDSFEYIKSTYNQHYVGKKEIQTLDVWENMGIAEDMCLGTIVKYAMRYGKKDGKNKKDLLKIIHYTILALHYGGHGETHIERNE
jgi:phage-related minor tail protein